MATFPVTISLGHPLMEVLGEFAIPASPHHCRVMMDGLSQKESI